MSINFLIYDIYTCVLPPISWFLSLFNTNNDARRNLHWWAVSWLIWLCWDFVFHWPRKKIFALVAMVLIVEIFVIDSLVLLHSWIVWLHLVSPAAIVWLHLLSNFHKFKFWQECMAATYVSTKLLNSSFSICYFEVIN